MSSIKTKLTTVNRLLAKDSLTVSDIKEMLDINGELNQSVPIFPNDGLNVKERLTMESLNSVVEMNIPMGERACHLLLLNVYQEECDHPGFFNEMNDDGTIRRLLTAYKDVLDKTLHVDRLKHQAYQDDPDLEEDHLFGRVTTYSTTTGYGFIHGEDGKDIFVSSMDICNNKRETSMRTGAIVTYVPVIRDGRTYATNIRIRNAYPVKEIRMPDGFVVDPWDIDRIGISKSKKHITEEQSSPVSADDTAESGIDASESNGDLYLYVKFRSKRRREIRYYDQNSSRTNVFKTDVMALYKEIQLKLFIL